MRFPLIIALVAAIAYFRERALVEDKVRLAGVAESKSANRTARIWEVESWRKRPTSSTTWRSRAESDAAACRENPLLVVIAASM